MQLRSLISELQQTDLDAEIHLNHELTVYFPENLPIVVEPNQMVAVQVIGNSLKFSYCELEWAIIRSSMELKRSRLR
jgi:hypothetical protein